MRGVKLIDDGDPGLLREGGGGGGRNERERLDEADRGGGSIGNAISQRVMVHSYGSQEFYFKLFLANQAIASARSFECTLM